MLRRCVKAIDTRSTSLYELTSLSRGSWPNLATKTSRLKGLLSFFWFRPKANSLPAWAKAEEDIRALNNSAEDTAVSIAKLQHFRDELDRSDDVAFDLDPTLNDASLTAFASDEKMLDKAIDFSERALIASSSMVS